MIFAKFIVVAIELTFSPVRDNIFVEKRKEIFGPVGTPRYFTVLEAFCKTGKHDIFKKEIG